MNFALELFKEKFKEFCCLYSKYHIDNWFTEAGFTKIDSESSKIKREHINDYYLRINWNNTSEIEKFLKVVQKVLLYATNVVPEDSKEHLSQLCQECGLEVDSNGYTVYLAPKSGHNNIRNIIFASNRYKPEIIFSDSLNNDIELIRNEEYCLKYNRPIHTHGLLWTELIEWWKEDQKKISWTNSEAGDSLYQRLKESLNNNNKPNPAEIRLFEIYYHKLCPRLGEKSPALLPQVYLHYDPYTIKELKRMNKKERLKRQRMDFLLLLPKSKRVVIEIDGKQHYSNRDTGIADCKLYAEMVAEDRRLKLLGYEVFRFGGYEMMQDNYATLIEDFFMKLFDTYEINVDF